MYRFVVGASESTVATVGCIQRIGWLGDKVDEITWNKLHEATRQSQIGCIGVNLEQCDLDGASIRAVDNADIVGEHIPRFGDGTPTVYLKIVSIGGLHRNAGVVPRDAHLGSEMLNEHQVVPTIRLVRLVWCHCIGVNTLELERHTETICLDELNHLCIKAVGAS